MTAETPLERPVRLTLVVATIGREIEFKRFLDALGASKRVNEIELILVDQGADRSTTRMLTKRNPAFKWQAITSERGVAAGRAAGAAIARGDLLGIPNDNCWYPPNTLSQVLNSFDAVGAPDVVSGRLITSDGRPSALRWAARRSPLTKTNWMRRSISSTMFFRLKPVLAVGSFDPTIGTGSAGPVQSGEETDLLLRMLGRGCRASYNPDICIFQEDSRDRPTPEFVRKMHGYGRGQGHLWRKHGLPRTLLAWFWARKLVGACVNLARGERTLARADLAFVEGWAQAYLGLGHAASHKSVSRDRAAQMRR